MQNIYTGILLDVLLKSITEYFYQLCRILSNTDKIQLSNTTNRYVCAGEFLTGPLKYKYCMIFVIVFCIICTLQSVVG